MRFSFTCGIIGSQLSAGQARRAALPIKTACVTTLEFTGSARIRLPRQLLQRRQACSHRGTKDSAEGQQLQRRHLRQRRHLDVDVDVGTKMSRGKDFAVGGFWLVALILFIAGQQQRLYLPERDKHKADPLFYTGIVLIAIATPVLLCYLVIRVSRSGAAARVADPASDNSDPDEWVSLLPGGLLTFKGKRERPDARFWSTMALRLGTPTLFLTPCVDIGLTADVCGGDGKFAPFAAPTPVVCLSCFAGLWLMVRAFVEGSHARSSCGKTYLDLHLGCVSLAALTLTLSIVLCLTLGPPIARRVAHSEYDDDEELDKQGTDAHLFYNAATYRCVLLAFVLATIFCSARLRCAAGKPPSGDAVELGPRGENPMSAPEPMKPSVPVDKY